jgi:hypothetical protein
LEETEGVKNPIKKCSMFLRGFEQETIGYLEPLSLFNLIISRVGE